MNSKVIEKDHLVAVPAIVKVSSLGRGKLNLVLPVPTGIDFITFGDRAEVFIHEFNSGKALVYLLKENKKERQEEGLELTVKDTLISGIIIGLNHKQLWGIGLSQASSTPRRFNMALSNTTLEPWPMTLFTRLVFQVQGLTIDSSNNMILQSTPSTRFDKAPEGDIIYDVSIDTILRSFCQDKLITLVDLPQWHEEHKEDAGQFLLVKAKIVEKEHDKLIINDTEFQGGVLCIVPAYLNLPEIEKDTEVYLTGCTNIKDYKLFIDVFGVYPLTKKEVDKNADK